MRFPAGPRIRLIALAYSAGLLVWLSLEESGVESVALLGLGLTALILVLTISARLGGRRIAARAVPLAGALLGALAGMGTAVAAAALMFFKNAFHAHIFLDYPPGLIGAVLQRAPAWTLAGALLGLGVGLAWLALRTGRDADGDDEQQV